MSYLDLNTSFNESLINQEFDYCIVGSGPAGLTLVSELAKDINAKILLIEAGGLSLEEKSQNLYKGNSFNLKNDKNKMGLNDKDYLSSSRLRYLGGSSNHWDGWTRPLDAIDFQSSKHSWPITHEEMLSFYKLAYQTLDIKPTVKDEALTNEIRKIPYLISPPVMFGKKYHSLLNESSQIKALLNANLCDINLNSENVTESITVKNYHNKEFRLKAKKIILACGGIENARLLLNFSQKKKAFQSPVLGKFFNDHLFLPMDHSLFIYGDKKSKINHFISSLLTETTMPALALSEKTITKNSFNNSGLLILQKSEHSENAPRVAREGILYDCLFISEVKPLNESHIALSSSTDFLGLKKIDFNWKISSTDLHAPFEHLKKLDYHMNLSQLGKVRTIFDYQPDSKIYWEGYHHMSTTLMGEDPQSSYVDKNLKIHGIKNCFVAGSSVFPSPGFANPTLTIVALSHRLAQHLKGLSHA